MSPLRTSRFMFVNVIIFISTFFITNTCKVKKPLEPEVCPDPFIVKAVDYQACWCPCGDSIVLVRSTPNRDSTGIYIIDTAGTYNRFVLWGPLILQTRWSPKGDWILFERSAQIYKVKTNGDSLTRLTFSGENFYPNWSPDGSKIVYDRTDSLFGIWVMNADGSNKKWIIRGRNPGFSPDGSKILYVGLGLQLFVCDTTGANAVQLGSLSGIGAYNPSFSPQGNKIVFSQQLNRETVNIWVMNSDGSNVNQLTFQGGDWPCWTSDGSWIVYTNTCVNNGYLWLIRPDGSSKRQITF